MNMSQRIDKALSSTYHKNQFVISNKYDLYNPTISFQIQAQDFQNYFTPPIMIISYRIFSEKLFRVKNTYTHLQRLTNEQLYTQNTVSSTEIFQYMHSSPLKYHANSFTPPEIMNTTSFCFEIHFQIFIAKLTYTKQVMS